MHAQIRVTNHGHNGAWRAGRFFGNGLIVRMEVLEETNADERGNGPVLDDGKLDMTRINRAGFESIKADGRFSVLSDAETSGGISQNVLDIARRQAAEAASRLSDARIRIAELEEENAHLAAALESVRGELAALKAAEIPPAQTPAPPSSTDAPPANTATANKDTNKERGKK